MTTQHQRSEKTWRKRWDGAVSQQSCILVILPWQYKWRDGTLLDKNLDRLHSNISSLYQWRLQTPAAGNYTRKAKAPAIFTHVSYNFDCICCCFDIDLVHRFCRVSSTNSSVCNHQFIFICSDKEQVIPAIDADQAHALLSSGHGYIDVRCITQLIHACCNVHVYWRSFHGHMIHGCKLTGGYEMKWIFRMREDFDKGHAPGSRNVPYYLSVTPQGQFLDPACSWRPVCIGVFYWKVHDIFQIELSFGDFVRFSSNLH